jgi:hypothetical protein
VFHVKAMVGPFQRGWVIPNALPLVGGSPVLGMPALQSVQPGSYSQVVPGTVNFPVPNYNTLTVTVEGAGGGGSSDVVTVSAGGGGTSSFASSTALSATGGLAGIGPVPPDQSGSGGSGSIVTTGGGGLGGSGIIGGAGGTASFPPGTYGFMVPTYTVLTVDVAAGGGGATDGSFVGQNGNPSIFPSVTANGGGGCDPQHLPSVPGGGSGGTVTTGGGGAGSPTGSANGVPQYNGAAGGRVAQAFTAGALAVGGYITVVIGSGGLDGGRPVQNSGNGWVNISWTYSPAQPAAYYNGSKGGRVTKTWLPTDAGAPVPGTNILLMVGAGGVGAVTPLGPAQPGANGRANISWS